MRRRILVVDDNAINRKILCNILSAEYEIIEAADGMAALTILEKEYKSISALMLDLGMPVLDGYGVLKIMREDERLMQIPVIVTTGSTEEEAEAKALNCGANDFVFKPYNPAVIKLRLRNAINLRENIDIARASRNDSLTGLYSRSAFLEIVENMISEQPAGYYVMAYFDVDNFKVINDRYGSKKGDRVIKNIAKIFAEGFEPEGGICCRVTADHFAVLYPKSLTDSTKLEVIQNKAKNPDSTIEPITFSIGRYIIDDLSISTSAMYDRAAIAKESVKRTRYGIKIANYDEKMRERILQEQELADEMHSALKTGQFEAWLQPQYNHSTGALIGAEALARWRHPRKGLIPPLYFIPVFENNGFVYDLDRYMWESCCKYIRKWIDSGLMTLPVSVNVSRYDMIREDFFKTITGLVEKYDIPKELLRIEVTESAFSESSEMIIHEVKKLIDYGFLVEIDDFGSGYSSLNTLKDVPASLIKLDMKFLENSEDPVRGGNIVESVIRMAKWLKMPVIAEGVETKEQADYLRSIGCFYIQGYLYARPMPVEEYERFIINAEKETKSLMSEVSDTLDCNAFWDPNSDEMRIFNSYAGGACIFESNNGKLELIRINSKYAEELGGVEMSLERAIGLDLSKHMDEENYSVMIANLNNAEKTGSESVCVVSLSNITEEFPLIYLRISARMIAKSGKSMLFYALISNVTEQKTAKRNKQVLEKQFCAVIDGLGGGVTLSSFEGDRNEYIFVNDEYYRMYGYTKEQYESEVKNGVFDLIHPDDVYSAKRAAEDARKTGSSFDIEYRAFKRDKTMIWVRSMGTICAMEGLDYPVQLVISNDITEKNNYYTLMNDMPGSYVRMKVLPNGVCVPSFFNRSFSTLVGMSIEELFAMYENDAMAGVHPDDVNIVKDAVAQMLKTGEVKSGTYRLRHGNGGYIRVKFFGRVAMRNGTEAFLNIYYTDMPESEKKEMSLREVLPFVIGAMMESTNEMSFVKDKSFKYICCSRKFSRLVGLKDPAEIVGKDDFDLFGHELAEQYRKADIQVMKSGEPLVEFEEQIPANGNEDDRYSATSKYPLYDTLGEVIGIYGVGRDITEERKIHSQLRMFEETLHVREEEYRLAIAQSGLLMCRYNCSSQKLTMSNEMAKVLGLPVAIENVPRSLVECGSIAAESAMDFIGMFDAIRRGEKSGGDIFKQKISNGNYHWYSGKFSTIFDDSGSPVSAVILIEDVDEEHKQAMAFERYTAQMKEEETKNGIAYLETDLTADIAERMGSKVAQIVFPQVGCTYTVALRSGFEKFSGQSEFLRMLVFMSRENLISEFMSNEKKITRDLSLMCDNGEQLFLKAEIELVMDPFSSHIHAYTLFRDVTNERKVELEVSKQAKTDELTGLFNRRETENTVKKRLSRGSGRYCALLVADLDNLKLINDNCGHGEGDVAIRCLAQALSTRATADDIIGRVGGDEFVMFIEGDSTRLLEELNALKTLINNSQLNENKNVLLSASIGAAEGIIGEDNYEELFNKADKALYWVKRNGKNNFAIYNSTMEGVFV